MNARRHTHRSGLFGRVVLAGHRGQELGTQRNTGHGDKLSVQRLCGRVRGLYDNRGAGVAVRNVHNDADRKRTVHADELRDEPALCARHALLAPAVHRV